MGRLTLLIGLFTAFNVQADLTAEDVWQAFSVGMRAYEAEDYEHAVAVLEEVLKMRPDCARCAHLLGKGYGRMAERANWTSAVGLAKKTRSALEQAVELAPDDADAIHDLIRFYRAAPGFLGGSPEKAEALERRLREAETEHTG
jgi:tetratricopeptide (TPR) repeat protein